MTPIASEWEVVKELFLEQYKESPKYQGIIEAMVSEVDYLENCLWELIHLLDVDVMTGAQLDNLGKIALVTRTTDAGTLTDVQFRLVIKAALRTRSSGSPEEIIAAVKTLTGASSVTFVPDYPAGFWVVPVGGDASLITQDWLDSISPAGVRGFLPCYLALESPPSGDPEEAFLFEDGDWVLIEGPCPTPEAGWGVGWGEIWGG